MNRLALAALLALAGCNATTIVAPKSPDELVADAEATYTGLVLGATTYVLLPRCATGGPVLCSTQANVNALVADQHKASATLDAVKAALATYDAITGPSAGQTAAITATIATLATDVGTFSAAATAFGVK
jgi:hypothetical protein